MFSFLYILDCMQADVIYLVYDTYGTSIWFSTFNRFYVQEWAGMAWQSKEKAKNTSQREWDRERQEGCNKRVKKAANNNKTKQWRERMKRSAKEKQRGCRKGKKVGEILCNINNQLKWQKTILTLPTACLWCKTLAYKWACLWHTMKQRRSSENVEREWRLVRLNDSILLCNINSQLKWQKPILTLPAACLPYKNPACGAQP